MKKALKLCLLPVTLSIMLTACNNERNSISSSKLYFDFFINRC